MDEIQVNGNDGALNFVAGVDDPFVIPPPLDGSLLFEDPVIGEQNEAINPQDNVDADQTQDSAEKKKKKRVIKPRVNLNEERLCSERGIAALKNLCSDVHFKGKGHEESDLNKLLLSFEHWAQCLMPRWPFNNVVEKCEVLGSKSRVKSELKRVRLPDEAEILRGEPEEDVEGIGQVEQTNEENSTEATSQPDAVPQEEQSPVELTEEQRERIRRNRLLAFEKREAKRRRLEEESQSQSQLEDTAINIEEEVNQQISSSQQPTVTDASSGTTAPVESLEDVIPDMDVDHNGGMDITNEAELIDIPESDSNVGKHNMSERDGLPEVPNIINEKEQVDGDEDMTTNVDQNGGMDITNDAELVDIPERDSNVGKHNMSERDGLPKVPNIINEKDQVDSPSDDDDDILSDDDDDILNRSAFDINPSSPTTSLPADTNIEPNAKNHEILENNNVQGDAAI